ncbi:MAG: DinB family protein, partial [Rhodothermales bacterium]|nr:DinB family protein [Rhodothermales bacterium]
MPRTFSLDETTQILSATPGTLGAMLAGLGERWTRADEGPNTWSAFDIVGHLVHGEETDWIPRARIILDSGPDPVFEPFDRFAQFERFRGATFDELLGRFQEARS